VGKPPRKPRVLWEDGREQGVSTNDKARRRREEREKRRKRKIRRTSKRGEEKENEKEGKEKTVKEKSIHTEMTDRCEGAFVLLL